MLRAVTTVGGFTLASRILGFLRDILIAALLGAGPVADAFFVAFKFPNFFRRLFAEGAFAAAFVPMFAATVAGEGRTSALRFAEQALGVLFYSLLVLVLAVEVSAPWLMYLLAPGFAGDAYKFSLAVEFLRVTFPYLLFIALVSLQGGILVSLGRFAAQAAAPILLNLCMIGALAAYAPLKSDLGWETPGHALAWGVAAAGLVQFLFLLFACRRAGVRLRLHRPRWTPEVKKLLARILPGAMGAGVVQVNLVIDVVIASLLPTGAVSYLYYADRVTQLPLGVIGVAVGTALLPLLSRHHREGAAREALESQNRALEIALLLTLPAAAALIALASPLVAVLFERGAFGPDQSRATAAALSAFAAGLPAFVLVKVLAPGYFARHDTATPVKIAIWAVGANLLLNLTLMVPFGATGIALATTLSAWLNAALLARGLMRRGWLVPDSRLRARLPRSLAAAAGMAVAVYGLSRLLAPWLEGGQLARAAGMAGLVAGGLAVFAGLAHLSGAVRLAELRRAFAPARRA
jgi:putative peptidoglycan lipid II flippase